MTNRYRDDITLEQLSARVRERVVTALLGTTLTRIDAEKIIERVQMCVSPTEKEPLEDGQSEGLGK